MNAYTITYCRIGAMRLNQYLIYTNSEQQARRIFWNTFSPMRFEITDIEADVAEAAE